MKVPESAAEINKPIENKDKENYPIIINPYFTKEKLTRWEAIDLINHISAALLADECFRS